MHVPQRCQRVGIEGENITHSFFFAYRYLSSSHYWELGADPKGWASEGSPSCMGTLNPWKRTPANFPWKAVSPGLTADRWDICL